MIKKTREEIVKVCQEARSMSSAARQLEIKYDTLKKYALLYNVWKTNQSGKGLNRTKIKLQDVLDGKIYISSGRLRVFLIKEKVKQAKCENCQLENWIERPISLELHHKDGDKNNNKLENLMILCPNCHSQTDNYRGRKMRI